MERSSISARTTTIPAIQPVMAAVLGLLALYAATSNMALASTVPLVTTGGVPGVTVTVPKKGTNNNNQVSVSVVSGGPTLSSVVITVPQGYSVSGLPGNATQQTTKDGSTMWSVSMGGTGTTTTFHAKSADGQSNLLGVNLTVTVNYADGTSKTVSPTVETHASANLPSGLPTITTTGGVAAFNGATGTLTFSGDFVTGTGYAGDPLLGASVLAPTYTLLGLSADGSDVIFQDEAEDSGLVQMLTGAGVAFESAAPFLFYDIANNDFSTDLDMLGLSGAGVGTAFYDGTLASLSSPGLALLNNELNPGGASFFPDIPLALSFTPGSNFDALTNNFTSSGSSGFVGSIFVTAPEPASVWMFISGVVALVVLQRRRKAVLYRK